MEEILALKQQQRSQGQELAQASCDSGILKPPESLTDDKRKISEKKKRQKGELKKLEQKPQTIYSIYLLKSSSTYLCVK